MRFLDVLRTRFRDHQDQEALSLLRDKLFREAGKRDEVIAHVPLTRLAEAILDFEGLYSSSWAIPEHPTLTETVALTEIFKHLLALQSSNTVTSVLQEFLEPIATRLPALAGGEDIGLSISVLERIENPAAVIDRIVRTALTSPFRHLQEVARNNLLLASGIDPTSPTKKPVVMPKDAKGATPTELVETYLRGTPFVDFFQTLAAFTVPLSVRFEHTHIVGGSGHGKTQLLQQLILRDLDECQKGRGSIIIIDSQGDMIRTITHLAEFSPYAHESLAERLVLIDPNDIDYPPCLNLFDFGLERASRYSAVEREKLLNGAIALYEYMFGALLGAELSQRQGVIFRYLGRLLMTVPGATIQTLREFMEDPEAARPHFAGLDGSARHFFETQFTANAFKDTRQQILNRLWGILSNAVLERMFTHTRNKINIFDAMNSGKIVLINTAKDLLKQDGCAIIGRFFIALITQAAQERAAIPADKRRACFLYVDEAQDYFDESIEQLFNQARKYKLGLIIAHQNLDQFGSDLLSSVMASTAIKLGGGMSAKDASAFAREMRRASEFLQDMRKREKHTEFACFIKNLTPTPLRLNVPFGIMEGRPRLTDEEHEALLNLNRSKYASGFTGKVVVTKQPEDAGFRPGSVDIF